MRSAVNRGMAGGGMAPRLARPGCSTERGGDGVRAGRGGGEGTGSQGDGGEGFGRPGGGQADPAEGGDRGDPLGGAVPQRDAVTALRQGGGQGQAAVTGAEDRDRKLAG